MKFGRAAVINEKAGWEIVTVSRGGDPAPEGLGGWAWLVLKQTARLVGWLARLVLGVVCACATVLVALLVVAAVASTDRWAGLGSLLAVGVGFVVWFARWPESFDVRVSSGYRLWWRRRRYRAAWLDVMVGSELTVKDRRERVLAPVVVRVKQGRFADVLTVKLPAGITRERFGEHLPTVCEAMRAREARIIPRTRRPLPRRLSWLGAITARRPVEFAPTAHQPGRLRLRLAFGDPLARTIGPHQLAPASEVDCSRVEIGRRDDGHPWILDLLGTHVLLAGATGAGKGSVLWSILARLGPAIRDGLVQVVGIDPKGGMELGFGRTLFRQLLTMDGPHAETEAVEFLESLAGEADRRAAMLAGKTRKLTPSTSLPFVVIVLDELASITAFLSDSKLRQRAEAALGRLLTKGRAPGMCVIAAVQDPRKEVVKYRDLFPTRIALRLVEGDQVGLVLGSGARARGARCDEIPDATPGVGYVVEDGTAGVTRVRAAYLTDHDIAHLAEKFAPGPVVAEGLHVVEGGDAA